MSNCPMKSCAWHGVKENSLFIVFLILGILIWGFKLNQPMFYTINSWHTIFPNNLWKALNFLSYSRNAILPILLLIITFVWQRPKIKQVVLLIIAYYVVFSVLKHIIGEARPYIALPPGSFFWIIHHENALKSAYESFPSGHTGNMAIFVFALSSFTNKQWIKVGLFLLLILVGMSRICTGWHWPLDVLTSGLISYVLVKLFLGNICCKNRLKA